MNERTITYARGDETVTVPLYDTRHIGPVGEPGQGGYLLLSRGPYEQFRTVYPDDPNQADLGAIYQSIQTNGFYGHVLVQRSTNRIISGHHRVPAQQPREG